MRKHRDGYDNTRFRQDFSNKSAGVSVFIIPPGNGLRHVVVVLGYTATGGPGIDISGQLGANALERGWGKYCSCDV